MPSDRKTSRRALLRGAGTIAVGLPFLPALQASRVMAEGPEPPGRAFNVFFGLGVPMPLQAEGYSGPLEPLGALRDKLCLVRGVDQVRCDEDGINAHFDGASGAFTGEPPNGEVKAGGPSIDQVLREALYPDGLPAGVIPSLLAGTFFRRSRGSRYIHSWNADGSPVSLPKETPRELFTRIFGDDGSLEGDASDPAAARRRRYRRSILDSVVEQYRHYKSDASRLSRDSRARIADHLDRIREHEQRVFGSETEGPACEIPGDPGASSIPHGSDADPDGQGIDIALEELVREWRLMADLYVLGVQCDRVRFGSLTFQAAGERIRLKGRYEYDGRVVYDFDDRAERGTGGEQGCSHEWWHDFREASDNPQLRAHVHLLMREVAYLLQRLDDPSHPDENGRTILENSVVTVSTESGDGRHSDVRRELTGVMHAISGANGRFRTGEIVDVGAEGIDLYNTMLETMGVSRRLGPSSRTHRPVDAIR